MQVLKCFLSGQGEVNLQVKSEVRADIIVELGLKKPQMFWWCWEAKFGDVGYNPYIVGLLLCPCVCDGLFCFHWNVQGVIMDQVSGLSSLLT